MNEVKEKDLGMTLHEVFCSVKFDDVVTAMRKYDELYMLRRLHNYKIEFDEISNTVPNAEGDDYTNLFMMDGDRPMCGDDLDQRRTQELGRGIRVLEDDNMTYEDIVIAALRYMACTSEGVIWGHCNWLNNSCLDRRKMRGNPYAQACNRLEQFFHDEKVPKRFRGHIGWKYEERMYMNKEPKRNRAKRMRLHRKEVDYWYYIRMSFRWELCTTISVYTDRQLSKETLRNMIMNAESLDHEDFFSPSNGHETEYIRELIERYYNDKHMTHDFALVLISAPRKTLEYNEQIKSLIENAGICHNPQFYLQSNEEWTGLRVQIFFVKNASPNHPISKEQAGKQWSDYRFRERHGELFD